MTRLTIRSRLALLSGALLLVLALTTGYLTHRIAAESAAMVRTAELLSMIERANSARLAFGELRYWNTDLAVSLLTLAERKAAAAHERLERDLSRLAGLKPQAIEQARAELAAYDQFASQAVDAYTADHRVIGNSFIAQARQHSIALDELLNSIITELNTEAIAARDRVVSDAVAATRIAYGVLVVAILGGALLTFFVLRSISGPLRRLVFAIDGLNAGNTEVPIPAPGPDEIGAMARTLALFRDSLKELHETLARLEALRGVGRTAGSTLDLETGLAIVAARAVEFSQAGAGIIYEYDEEAQEFRFWTSHGAEPELIEALKSEPIRRGEGAIGRAADARAPVQIANIARDDAGDAPAAWAALANLGYRSLLAAPLLREEEILGGLVVARRDAGGFPADIVDLIDAFATQSALAVRNATLFAEQARREQELRIAHEELKLVQASLLQAEKMASLGQLTAGIAHEIKNPLNFINNFASLSVELLDELKQAAAPALKTLDRDAIAQIDEILAMLVGNLGKVVEHGKRADGIVKSMLLHSRGSSGERQSVGINELVEEALNLAYHGARAQDPSFNITLERDFDPAATAIELVPQDITRVLLNLFGNGFYAAHKRTQDSGDPAFRPVLKVATRDLGAQIEIRVHDNGIGIPPEIRDKLFQPFFTTKPTGEGTGLGLSISYDIVTQQHGGTIEVDSEVGAFTEFPIRLPRPVGARRPVAAGFAA